MATAKKPRFDKDAAFKNIVGVTGENTEIPAEPAPQSEKYEAEKSAEIATIAVAPAPQPIKKTRINTDNDLVQKAYYIYKRQYKALKIYAATTDNPEEKDMSAIVRAALDQYLNQRM